MVQKEVGQVSYSVHSVFLYFFLKIAIHSLFIKMIPNRNKSHKPFQLSKLELILAHGHPTLSACQVPEGGFDPVRV